MASSIIFTVEDLRSPEGTELVLQQFRMAIDRIPGASSPAPPQKFSLSDLSPQDIADLAKLIRDQLQAPGAAPLNLQDLPGTPAGSGPAIPSGIIPTFVVGTLSPNTKPFLTILNIYQVVFYSTDFDHCYLWTGFTWLVMERTVGKICWFSSAPATNGWHLCDGTAGVPVSTTAGGTATVTVPDLITGNPYVRGGNAYSGPTSTAAIAPTISGSTGNESAHTHSVTAAGSILGNIPDHKHVLTASNTGGTGEFLISGAKRADVGHVGSTWTGVDGMITVGGSASITGSATGSESNVHQHDVSGTCAGVTDPNSGSTTVMAPLEGFDTVSVASDGHEHGFSGTISGTTTNENADHTHGPGDFGVSLASVTAQAFVEHFHTASGESGVLTTTVSNGLSFSGSSVTSGAGSAHSHTGSSLTVSATAEPLHMTLLPYYRL